MLCVGSRWTIININKTVVAAADGLLQSPSNIHPCEFTLPLLSTDGMQSVLIKIKVKVK